MSPFIVFTVIAGYFLVLIIISILTSIKSDNATFYTGNRKSPWYLVAFGMIGASLSGVTFISVPGWVASSSFSYFQMVMGYLIGYFAIALVLMPIYYKLNLVSIYTYLDDRFGKFSYKIGSFYFLLSRIIGAAFRLFLVAGVLQLAFFDAFNIPFYITVVITILLIWLYTFGAGIKTIVWTDTLQTTFMLLSVVVSIIIIGQELNLSFRGIVEIVVKHPYSQVFNWEWRSDKFFFKQFFAGAFMAFVMTGLDQDMMQKNLTCKNLKEAQKNMYWFSITLLPVNLLFLALGVLLYVYAAKMGISLPEQSDNLYPLLAINHFSLFAGIVFLLGIVAAAFSSADSAITALTTAFSVDFLNIDVTKKSFKNSVIRTFVHLGVSIVVIIVILIFNQINDKTVISQIFKVAGYTYGPLLGLFMFGLITKYKIYDKFVPIVAFVAPVLTYIININSEKWFGGYKFGFELLILNGILMFLGLLLLIKNKKSFF